MYARRATKRGPQAGDASDGILRCVYERPTTTLLRLEWGVWHAYCHVHVAWTRGFGWALVSLGRALPWQCQFFFFGCGSSHSILQSARVATMVKRVRAEYDGTV